MQSSKKVFIPKHLATSTSGSIDNYQCVNNPKTGRLECVFVNLEAVYTQASGSKSEYSFEELRARHRGWTDRQWSREEKTVKGKSKAKPSAGTALDQRDEQTGSAEPPMKGFKIHLDENSAPKPKQRGFKIFEDESSKPGPSTRSSPQNKVRTLALNDENDENAPPAQPTEAEIRKKMRREERANRTRKIQVMDVKHIKNETKTVQLNLDSPTGKKPKRKKNVDRTAEPTMTINTKEAMDEIYDIFNAPLASQTEQQSEESESEGSDSDEEDDYTTGDESTTTGKLSAAPSDYGDETRNELLAQAPADDEDEDEGEPTEHTGWSDFTTSKHVPREDEDPADGQATGTDRDWELYRDENRQPDLPGDDDDMVTPNEENVQTSSVPIASEENRPPSAHFQQMTMLPNHRLPFMTPIAEQTESNLGTITSRAQNDYFNNAKTPSRQASGAMPVLDDDDEDEDPPSSPFAEVTVDLNDDKFRVLQPIRTKSTKGNISLGKGTATSQIEAKSVAPSASEAVQKGPIILEQQCNPMDPYLRQTILSQIKPSLDSFQGYHDHSDVNSGRTAEIKKYIRSTSKANKNSQDKAGQAPSLPPVLQFEGSQATYTVKRELGAGTFAPVYLVENSEAAQAADDENSALARGVGTLAHRKPLEAIKMEEPLSAWEFFILQQSHRRLGVSRAAESIVRAHEMHMFRDECFLIEEYRNQGTLLDLVNVARADSASTTGGGMDEVMAMWLTVELFRTVEALHSKQIIHGDLKGDNVLVRFDDPGMETDWSPTYFPSGAHGWASKGVCLIDFGRGIDLKQFVPSVAFIADWKTSEADCAEMRELRPWTYQVDYHGMAGIVHSMLFGKYMETIADRGAALGQGATKTYRIRENLKRYWQVEIWQEIFALLLNPLAHTSGEEGKKMPVLNGMRSLRLKMEGWVEENCERGMGLKGMIARMEAITKEKLRRNGRA
jgi:checkpoint serine/threonine-protein kinase